jgi:uncharacterized protein YbbK (DUF523 family)
MTRLPRVGISRCLLGDDVRYDGRNKYEPSLLEALAGAVEWVPVCPELEAGMGVPREPVQLVAHRVQAVRLLGVESGRDWTDAMQAWTRDALTSVRLLGLSGFALKSGSPSCGIRDVPVVDAEPGSGLFVRALMAAMPGLPVEDEIRLRDPAVRAVFLDRIRERARRQEG